MSYNRRIIFSFLCIFQASLPINFLTQNENRNEPIKITPLDLAEIPQAVHEAINNEQLKQHFEQQETDTFSEEDIEEMELVFAHSPVEAQYIVNRLQDPNFFPENEDKSVFFVGGPRSGITTMARAIGYKLSKHGWMVKFLSSTSLLGEYRNQTAIRLQKELEAVAASDKPTIIIIDELHRLLENTASKNHDSDSTDAVLRAFLDKHEHNKKIFLIGTMSRVTKLSKPFKDRIISDYITFKPINDSAIKKNILRRHLTIGHISLDAEVTDDFLCAELEKLGPCFGRQLKKLSRDIYRIHLIDNADKTSGIKKPSITKAVSERILKKEEIQYNLEEETYQQRQERFHRENIDLKTKHHTERIQLQKENHFMHQKIAHEQLARQKSSLVINKQLAMPTLLLIITVFAIIKGFTELTVKRTKRTIKTLMSIIRKYEQTSIARRSICLSPTSTIASVGRPL